MTTLVTALAAALPIPRLAHALGWTLLHFCWQGAAVAILLAGVLGLLSGRPPQSRYLAGCCALALMLALPLLTFAYLAEPPALKSAVTNATVQTGQARGIAAPWSETQSWLSEFDEMLDRSLPWVSMAWFAGVIFLLSRLNIGLLAVRRMRSAAVQAAPAELQRQFSELSRRLRVARPAKVMNSALVETPMVIGWLRPMILMPLGCIAGLSPLQIEALLAHELAHIRRHDYLVNACQSLVETLLFYHPAVWWVSKQVRREREHCCDDIAVGACGNSLAYAKALSFLEEQRSLAPALSLGANGGALRTRIQRLLGCNPSPAVSRPAALTLFALAITAAGLYAGSIARAQTNAGDGAAIESRENLPDIPLVYRKWVNEDVRWIITPAERAAFLKLTNNTERDEFVRQFWERRNPSGENTFKQQYYRRIAYANRHFGAADVPGWLSDRGRVYIVYGPPTGIDAHPSDTARSSKPSQTWHYQLLRETSLPALGNPASGPGTTAVTVRKNVDMRFVDVCSCGDYRLQPSS